MFFTNKAHFEWHLVLCLNVLGSICLTFGRLKPQLLIRSVLPHLHQLMATFFVAGQVQVNGRGATLRRKIQPMLLLKSGIEGDWTPSAQRRPGAPWPKPSRPRQPRHWRSMCRTPALPAPPEIPSDDDYPVPNPPLLPSPEISTDEEAIVLPPLAMCQRCCEQEDEFWSLAESYKTLSDLLDNWTGEHPQGWGEASQHDCNVRSVHASCLVISCVSFATSWQAHSTLQSLQQSSLATPLAALNIFDLFALAHAVRHNYATHPFIKI